MYCIKSNFSTLYGKRSIKVYFSSISYKNFHSILEIGPFKFALRILKPSKTDFSIYKYNYIYIFPIKDSDLHNDVCEGSVEIFGVIIMIPVTIYLLWIFPLSLRLSESD